MGYHYNSNPMLGMTILFLLAFSMFIFLGVDSATLSSIATDREALISFKSQLSFELPNNPLSTWDNNSSTSPCNWTGVRCSNNSGSGERVTALDLSGLGLAGSIAPHIGNLSFLNSLQLQSNRLRGTLPNEICNLSRLKVLNLSSNSIEGSLPSNITKLKNLQILDLMENEITSRLPEELGFLSNLQVLKLGKNNFFGSIPSSLSNLSSLTNLNLGTNALSGILPNDLGRLQKLKELDITINNLTGQLQELQMLGLAKNNLSGGIPNSLGNLRRLNDIDLSGNSLLGFIPSSFGNFQNLLSLDLSNNKLNGSIPKESFNLQTLSTIFNLSNNFLSGPLPQDIQLEKVVTIDLSNNLLSGPIPSSIINCKSLERLFMAKNRLSGPIPNTISEVKGLEMLDLSSNQLSGSIPKDLEDLHALRYLNLSFNQLEGEVPEGGVFRNISSVHLEGNKKLCSNLKCKNSTNPGHRNRVIVICVVTAIIATLALCTLLFTLLHLRRRKATIKDTSETQKGQFQMVSYEELRRATGNFTESNLIGYGSFGSVYKGRLSDQTEVAVKVINTQTTGSWKSFVAECEALRNVRHRNLVRLITSCSSIDFKNMDFLALVYEYLSNGSLEDWIRGRKMKENGEALNIVDRLNVAIDVACALDYLHHDCEVPVVHCDIKPSNILLNEDFTAKIGDFGLARLLMEKKGTQTSISSTNFLKGSIGYIPPEYGQGEKPSTAGDTYSFGIMLLELFTGKCPIDKCFSGDLNLPRWVQSAFPENFMQVVDSKLLVGDVCNEERDDDDDDNLYVSPEIRVEYCLTTVIEIGLSCTRDSPDGRITIRLALQKLKNAKHNFLKNRNGKKV
ncbi:probable LRR receptor-like serine/threonine-protein kinase At3g47570 isoform X2 [Ziziphus jujuba]|uniref:Probable LRR receptor-like serine/threonine-protein kinase At3g47570 isoform X2 n=1 Tax=Ziziphus jujuba TaxID=326968 RepID=A0ABM4A6U3_ZIZJJ|nr:probable LRR receptor-like serine/threonine-protein kinase At3g47570 isoform X2 [Ziziphus jujuba]